MTSPAKNEYILITGASSGIGRALAAEGASRGHNLFLVALPHDGLDDFVQEMKEKHKVEVKYNTAERCTTKDLRRSCRCRHPRKHTYQQRRNGARG